VSAAPDNLDDPLFGPLQWDSKTKWWGGSVPAVTGERFSLSVQPRSNSNRAISDAARQVYAQLRTDFEEIRQHAIQQFFTETCGQMGDDTFTLDQLLTYLRPDAIMVRSDGYLEVGFADREERVLRGGHIIVSRFWPSGTREVVLEG
jgi:hypothetical protein